MSIRAVLAVSLLLGAASVSEAAHVTITRDDWGIAHVKGTTDADAVFGMIYAQAEDDFNRVETNYLTNLGRLAEAQGESALWKDLRQRLFVDPVQLQAQYTASPPWLKKLMQAWADGLNFYLQTHPGVHPLVLTKFEPWMALSFTEGSIGGDIERVPLTQLQAFYDKKPVAMTQVERGVAYREPQGSNGLAIAPSHTQNGHALLLINPHTSFFFRSELQMTSDEGLNAYGAVTWGQFFIYQGFNAKAGWMHTSSGVDNVDEFAESIVTDTHGKLTYRYGNESRPVTSQTVTLSYRTAAGKLATRDFTTYATHHGPIVREEGGKWIAFALMNRPVVALQQSFLRTKATDYASFLKVARLQANSSNNTLFADSKGEIAYLHPQYVPIRADQFDYRKPVDGSDPATDWQGLHSLESLPHVVSPANGWTFNSNNWPWTSAGDDSPKKADFPRYMDQVGENPRGAHAIRVLSARSDFTPQTLIAAAFDPYLPAFARLVPTLLASYDRLPDSDPRKARLQGPIELLRGWDFRWGLTSKPTSLAVFYGETLWPVAAQAAKDADMTVWDYAAERTTDAQRLAALVEASDRLVKDFGSWSVPWGEINRFQRNDGAVVQSFSDTKASIPIGFTSSQWGSLAAFGAKRYPGTKCYYGTVGNSFIAAVEFGPKVEAWAISAGGENGDPHSRHFLDQAQR
ncbi:MAG: acyl-homoserine-lactone acylase, partial [Gammaproteobacteria bacterium]|nr:acyl-homoserine-lactone acylase [Gammaproteobacteria bacterium]